MKRPQPSPLSRTLALVPPAIALLGPQADAAFDIFLKIDTIPGEYSDKLYQGWIKVDSVSWGASRSVSSSMGSGREASEPALSEVIVAKAVDKTSPKLFLEAVAGRPMAVPVKLEFVDLSTGTVFYRITLSNVLVSSQSFSASRGADRGSESISFNFTKIQVESLVGKTVVATGGYDLETAKSF